jgi:hypothetical protein
VCVKSTECFGSQLGKNFIYFVFHETLIFSLSTTLLQTSSKPKKTRHWEKNRFYFPVRHSFDLRPFQSQVCLRDVKALRPLGHLTPTKQVAPVSPAWSHPDHITTISACQRSKIFPFRVAAAQLQSAGHLDAIPHLGPLVWLSLHSHSLTKNCRAGQQDHQALREGSSRLGHSNYKLLYTERRGFKYELLIYSITE